jgi:hypothetical protein
MGIGRPGKRIVLAILLISVFLFIAFAISSHYNSQHMVDVIQFSCPLGTQIFTIYDLIPLLVTASLIFGAGIYYLMEERMEVKEQSMKRNTDLLLRFLGEDERMVVSRLLESRGRLPQSEITRIRGLSKVKAHRIVKRLAARGIAQIEKQGKTNVVTLAKDIREGLA